MSASHVSGPLTSTNGFIGAVTGAITGNVTGDVTGNITGTGSSALTKLSTGATPVPLVDIAGTTLTPAASTANVCLVTIQLKDGAGTAIARIVPIRVYLSDSSTGAGVTGTTASGAVAVGANGTDIVDLTSKKVKEVLTDATGKYILSITDTAKTGFYVVATVNGSGVKPSAQLVTGNYG